ncbi:hypothetical protein BEP19_15770 [Ammoniphilus oxalaticus]|uniref:YolD-like family protein n=1 Tax=Ammoniphilus oxalaticus TaxID=66863 RepID=A0A419SDD8_9BACL|nr:YolD-like family protein [Ammoniphilus oxalaticus]RKD21129.1 hypothetical protein BEP19_15770 [Ammoniphilus oxalaticus]
MIKDRGNIKWTAMMLPEHRAALHELEVSQDDVDPPSKSEDELGALAEKLAQSMQDEVVVSIKYWQNKRNHQVVGIVKRIDSINKAILVDASIGDAWDRKWIPATHLVDIELN